MTSASEENEKITTLEAALASPPFNDLEGGNELNSLESFAMGDAAIKSTTAREGHPSGSASEMSMKFGASEGLHSFPFSNRLPGCLAGKPLLSPQSVSSSHRSKSCVPLEEPHSGYSPIGPVASARFNEISSDWRCSSTNTGPCTVSNCQNGCINHDSVHQGGPPSSAWGVIEEQQERLESLQQAICYCEERRNMGNALRSREAAVRARLLHEQLQQQSHSGQARKGRNNSLMNEAVGLCLRKTILPHRPAAERLGACLSALHKHMEKSLSSSAFAVASTTPGIGGIRSSISSSLPQKDHGQLQNTSKSMGLKPLNDTSGTSRSTQQEASGASITKEYSKASTSILYEGAADALAARELVQTRAKLLLQKQLDNNTSDSLQQLLSLESDVRGQIALLGAGVNHKEQQSGTASGEPANDLDDNTSPSIPEEAAGLHRQKMLPQSQPQRLIAHSQLRCSSANTQGGKGKQYQTNVSAKFKDSAGIELPPALGEQQLLNLSRQISVLQEMLLRIQQPHQKLQCKIHGDRQHACSEGSMQRVGHKGVNAEDSSISQSGPLEKEVAKPSSSPAGAKESTIPRRNSKNSADFSRYVNARYRAESGRRSAAEERLRRHQLRLQQQIEQRERGKHEAARQRTRRRGDNDRPCENNNFAAVGDAQINDSARSANAAKSHCKNNDSNRRRWADTVHKVRSYSGTPLASATPLSCEKPNNDEYLEPSSAKSIKRDEIANRLLPMGEETLPMNHGVPERSKVRSEQMRPYGTIGTPPLLPAPLAATTAAIHQPIASAELSEARSKKKGMQSLLTENGSKTQDQRISSRMYSPQSRHQLASAAALPPPEEMADLLLGIK